MKRERLFWHLVWIFQILLLCGCTDHALKRSINTYRGDGEIRYLEAPLLGISGCAIQMPSIDLSRPVYARYDFTGIPPGKHYIVYLVVPEPCPLDAIRQGVYELRIVRNDFEIKHLQAAVSDMTNSQGPHDNQFYFYSYRIDQEMSSIDVCDSTSRWSMVVSYTNAVLKEPVEAYILITRGGYK